MLKLQKPYNINEYVAVDPIRTNELHNIGFIPEYLYNNMMYFKISDELLSYLNHGIKPKRKESKRKNKYKRERNYTYK